MFISTIGMLSLQSKVRINICPLDLAKLTVSSSAHGSVSLLQYSQVPKNERSFWSACDVLSCERGYTKNMYLPCLKSVLLLLYSVYTVHCVMHVFIPKCICILVSTKTIDVLYIGTVTFNFCWLLAWSLAARSLAPGSTTVVFDSEW